MSMIDMTASPDVAALDFNTAREMAEVLHSAYPGHLWAVTCEGEKGIATVRNLSLSGQWGFILKLNEMSTSSDWKKRVLVAGGELLERLPKCARPLASRPRNQSRPPNPPGLVARPCRTRPACGHTPGQGRYAEFCERREVKGVQPFFGTRYCWEIWRNCGWPELRSISNNTISRLTSHTPAC